MLSRSNVLLLVLLVVQLVLLAISVITTSGTQAPTVEPIVLGMKVADIERLYFTDDLGNEVTVARREDGWALPGADDFPVDGDKVEAILEKIAGMDARRLVATNRANFVRLEVGDNDFRRKIMLESGDASVDIYLGGSGGADSVYVRRAGEDEVYLGLGLNSWELSTQISTWLDSSYVTVSQDDVLEITVQNAEGSFTFVRADEGMIYTDLGEGEQFEDTKVPIILRNAATIRLLEPLGLAALDEYEMAAPQVTVDVRYRKLVAVDESAEVASESQVAEGDSETSADETVDAEPEYSEETYSLAFGAVLDDGVALKSSDAEYYVLVRDTVFSAFNDLSRADLVKAPEAEGEMIGESGG
ncbi:MAG: DUF4340 domain-containing protein [Chloroflexota bacterium]|nr:DUF4340 domain-containing protein [Chloroflexota bacterium]MDE2908278.1 DUF4340 domain-containing protein [Chloroflexota bacterium]